MKIFHKQFTLILFKTSNSSNRVDRLNGPKMLFVWGAGISASRESSSDSIYLAHGVFVVSVLQGRSAPTDVFEWNRTNNGVDDLPGAMS